MALDPSNDLPMPRSSPRGFWHRLAGWLRPWRSDTDPGREILRQGDDLGGSIPAGSSDLAWPRRRTSQMSRLEEGFDRLVTLIDAIDQHLQKQADRSDQLIGQTRRVADAITQTQGLERQRTEAVEQMADQYRNQTRQMQQVAEAVEALPRTIKHQSEQLGQIRDQLEAQLEAQLSTAQGVQQIGSLAESVRSAVVEQRGFFQQLHESQQSHSMQIVQSLERQNRRFTWLLGLATGLSVVAIALVVVAVVLMVRSL